MRPSQIVVLTISVIAVLWLVYAFSHAYYQVPAQLSQPTIRSRAKSIREKLTINKNNRLFYIYNVPGNVSNSWPQKVDHFRAAFTNQFRENYGAGMDISASRGYYHTHQYSLFMLLFQRLLTSRYRTLDPDKASLFFIPYDLGMDASVRGSDGALFQTNCPRLAQVQSMLSASPYFSRRQGSDHFVVHSINQMMVYYATKTCLQLYKQCFNCTKLSIDTYERGIYSFLDENNFMTHKWISIPFPSNHHDSPAVKEGSVIWKPQPAVGAAGVPAAAEPGTNAAIATKVSSEQQRWYALSFVGSVKVTAKKQQLLRSAIIAECTKRMTQEGNNNDCFVKELTSHDSNSKWYSDAKNINDKSSDNINDIYNISSTLLSTRTIEKHLVGSYDIYYKSSRFCLMPGGDFPTRKGLLDAMLSGCIPVTFELAAGIKQWTHHWGSQERAQQCVVNFPREEFMKDVPAAFDKLVAMSKNATLVHCALQCIASVGYRMQVITMWMRIICVVLCCVVL